MGPSQVLRDLSSIVRPAPLSGGFSYFLDFPLITVSPFTKETRQSRGQGEKAVYTGLVLYFIFKFMLVFRAGNGNHRVRHILGSWRT